MPPLSVEKDTVALYFVEAALMRLPVRSRSRVLAVADIPPSLLDRGLGRVPAAAFAALWKAVAFELDDEFFGLDRRRMKVGSFALICQAVLSCKTLDAALRRMLRGLGLFLDDVRGELQIEGDSALVRIHNRIEPPAARRFADETFLILLHGLLCWLIGRRLAPQQVEFALERPAHAGEYTLMYSEHCVFDAPMTCLHLPAQALAAPVVQNAATLQQFLAQAPQSVFLKYRNEESWTSRLRRRLREGLGRGEWPSFEALAADFDIAPTTLRRRLEAEGGGFQALKDGLRNDLAIDRLGQSTLSVDAIAAELGFQDASAFHRAFKRWNGMQPGEYRSRQTAVARPACPDPTVRPIGHRA